MKDSVIDKLIDKLADKLADKLLPIVIENLIDELDKVTDNRPTADNETLSGVSVHVGSDVFSPEQTHSTAIGIELPGKENHSANRPERPDLVCER